MADFVQESFDEASLRRQIERDFPEPDQTAVLEELKKYAGPERNRVIRDILQLSGGSLAAVQQYLEIARIDYRDILYWAEYYKTDPMVKDRDPKEFVDEILRKLKTRE